LGNSHSLILGEETCLCFWETKNKIEIKSFFGLYQTSESDNLLLGAKEHQVEMQEIDTYGY